MNLIQNLRAKFNDLETAFKTFKFKFRFKKQYSNLKT